MDNVTVSKADLLTKLKDNRDKHKAEFEAAQSKHREQALGELRKRIVQIDGGGQVDLKFDLPTPTHYLDSFDEAIQMLEWEQENTIELDQTDFKRFVMNKWEWQRHFAAATSMYNA